MGQEIVRNETNLQGEAAVSAEDKPEDPYRWGNYFPYLLEQVSEFGELSETGKQALREFYEGRKEIEKQWGQREIDAKERNEKKGRLARQFSIKYDDLFEKDKAFEAGIGIIRDQTG